MKLTKIIVAIALIFSIAACGLIKIDILPKPSPTPTPTATPIVNPTIEPTPTATPTPTVEPTASPTPTPSPSPTPFLCALPAQTEPSVCTFDPDLVAHFDLAVRAAQDRAVTAGLVVDGKIVGEDVNYINFLVSDLKSNGYCAINGRLGGHTSDDEVWVKDVQTFSQHFDVVTSDNRPWIKYTALCKPAKF